MDNSIRKMYSLEGKFALVTGARRNFGAEMALGLAEAGATVAITARTIDKAREGADALKAQSGFSFVPMELELTVSAPSIEDAYLSAGRECADNAEMWKAMADYIESGKAEMLEETRTVKLHKSGEKVYPEPEPDIANVLTGGYAEYTARMLAEAEE